MGDLFDNDDLSLLGNDSTSSPTYNLGGYLANMAGSAAYSMGMQSGLSFNDAGLAGAQYGNAVSASNGTLPGQSTTSANPSTSAPGTSNSTTASSTTMTRIVAIVVGVVLVIGALYLFGSSAISDSITGAVSKLSHGAS